jgi:hypothetical protein
MAINFVFRVCLLIELILTLSGCGGFGGAALTGLMMGSWGNYTPPAPRVLCTTEDSIGVNYHFNRAEAESYSRHDQAMQLISEHCVRGYIEVNRTDSSTSVNVYAMCLQVDGSPSDSQPCEYDIADENVGFGKTDPAIPDG